MNKNQKIIVIAIVLLTIISIITVFKKDTNIVEKNKINKIERKEFSILKEQTYNGEDWELSNDTAFPTSGYLLNETQSKCYGYDNKPITPIPVKQELTKGSIDGRVTIESSKTIYCELYFDIDNKVPEVNTFSITGKTSSGTDLNNGYTYQTNDIPYTLEYGDTDVTQYCISNTSECTEWKEISEKTDTLTIDATDGEKTMYIYLKDKANNISVTTDKTTAKIIVDRTAPVIDAFTLTGAAESGQTLSNPSTYTHKTGITYNATIEESNIDSYCIYEDSCSYQTTSSTTLKDQNYTLKDTEGSHSVKIKVKDKAGNESDITTQSIKLDKTNPTATIKSNSQDTSSITVTVGYEGQESIIGRQCRISLPTVGEWTDAEEDGSCTISNLSDGTPYTIEGRVRDASGRYSQAPFPSVSVTTDYAYRCDVGTLVEDPSKGWICTTSGKSLIETYWTCSADLSQKYSSEGQAASACESSEPAGCSESEKSIECVGGRLVGSSGWCATGKAGVCALGSGRWSGFYMCSVRGNNVGWVYQNDCTEVCFEGYDTIKKIFICEFDRKEYTSISSCRSSCVETTVLGIVSRRDDVSYYCESGWSELSHSGTSELVCYKDAIRG